MLCWLRDLLGPCRFKVCPKADSLYPIVSAASIVAKVCGPVWGCCWTQAIVSSHRLRFVFESHASPMDVPCHALQMVYLPRCVAFKCIRTLPVQTFMCRSRATGCCGTL